MRLMQSCVLWSLWSCRGSDSSASTRRGLRSVPQEETTWVALWRHITGFPTQPFSLLSYPHAVTPFATVDPLLKMLVLIRTCPPPHTHTHSLSHTLIYTHKHTKKTLCRISGKTEEGGNSEGEVVGIRGCFRQELGLELLRRGGVWSPASESTT